MGLQIKLEIRVSNVEISVVQGVRDSEHLE